MLSRTIVSAIRAEAETYWIQEVQKTYLTELAQGKEIGHKLADLVDDKTTALLKVNHLTKQQKNLRGEDRARSMGDLWLEENGIYHPINVKTGIVGAEGQPNLVSLKKLLRAVMERWIDSYYLLIVKLRVERRSISSAVVMIDILDWLDYVTFDSGPGQMMLKAAKFFNEYSPSRNNAPASVVDKLGKLMELYEDGERRLKENRARDLERYRSQYMAFVAGKEFRVTPETQGGLRLS